MADDDHQLLPDPAANGVNPLTHKHHLNHHHSFPLSLPPDHDTPDAPQSGNPVNAPDTSESAVHHLIRASTTPILPLNTSAPASPKPSREGSPVRLVQKQAILTGTQSASRSRKNSQEFSPVRSQSIPGSAIPTVPSAAAIQRALSAAGTPHLPSHSNQDSGVEPLRPQKLNRSSTGSTSQHGRSSTRLSSPPPTASAGAARSVLSTARKIDQAQSPSPTPKIVVESPSRSSTISDPDVAEEEQSLRSGMRTPGRGASGSAPVLETVQESSLPCTPAIGTGKLSSGGKNAGHERPDRIEENPMEAAFEKETRSRTDSGNESAGTKSVGTKSGEDGKETRKSATAPSSSKPPAIQSKGSIIQMPAKAKAAGEGAVQHMTVETETVSSIPQVALGGGAGERNALGRTDTGGSLRLKPSNETIRPKDKKKVARKAPSMKSGTASSKADIFEAKVASAVDEANSTDSEETFVYESNPPEPHSARPNRFHSRTPSTTSTTSQMDHYGTKGRPDGHHSVVGKKSMKFANNYNSINYSNDGEGTVRGPGQNGRGGTSNHHHIGRYGRGGHTSLFDTESPFPNATKPTRSSAGHLPHLSLRNYNPRNSQSIRVSGTARKAEEVLSYDLEGEGADDERAPLIGSRGSARNRRRPLPGSVRQMYTTDDRHHRRCNRVMAFTILGSVLAVLVAAIILILVMCTKPLEQVYIKDIRDVLASEQEIMLDLNVHAINPNLIAIQVSDLDVNIFAKSKHVGTSSHWRSGHANIPDPGMQSKSPRAGDASHGSPFHQRSDIVDQLGGVDEGTDPIDNDPASDSQTMLLGQIFEFDSPLIFDPSPIRHQSLSSIGEVRLARPGNHTEEGGSERWEHVLRHDFELIVRGVIRYSLPISSRTRSVKVGGRVIVQPSDEVDEMGGMRLRKPVERVEAGRNRVFGAPAGYSRSTEEGEQLSTEEVEHHQGHE